MPNFVKNRLTAPAFVINHILNDTGEVDFETLVPMPKVLQGTKSGCSSSLGSYSQTANKLYSGEMLLTELLAIDDTIAVTDVLKSLTALAATNGKFDNWFEWTVARWGCKWNARKTQKESPIAVTFETPWSFPEKWYETLSAKYPKTEMKIEWADEDAGSNCGEARLEDGQIIHEFEYEWDAEDAARLWGIDPEELSEY